MSKTQIRVRGYHCDAYGHVNNARYLEFLEEARWEFLQPAVDENFFNERNLIFVVAKINVEYKKPIVPNDLITVNCDSIKFSNKSLVISQTIENSVTNTLCNRAEVSFVLLDSQSYKPTSITSELIDKFNHLITLYNA